MSLFDRAPLGPIVFEVVVIALTVAIVLWVML